MKRRKGIFWEYNGDGMFSRERIKGAWKRYWRRWLRRQSREALQAERGVVEEPRK